MTESRPSPTIAEYPPFAVDTGQQAAEPIDQKDVEQRDLSGSAFCCCRGLAPDEMMDRLVEKGPTEVKLNLFGSPFPDEVEEVFQAFKVNPDPFLSSLH